jgi:hypothetical protein
VQLGRERVRKTVQLQSTLVRDHRPRTGLEPRDIKILTWRAGESPKTIDALSDSGERALFSVMGQKGARIPGACGLSGGEVARLGLCDAEELIRIRGLPVCIMYSFI